MAGKKDEKDDKKSSDNQEQDETKKKSSEAEEKDSSEDKIASLEKKIGEFGEYIGATRSFIDGASVVVQTIADSPELRKAFQEELKKKNPDMVAGGEDVSQKQGEGGQEAGTASQSTDEIKASVEDLKGSQREQIVQNFESKYGIDKLSEDERKDVRQKVAGYLAEFGWKIGNMPLQVLGRNLERAYVGTHAEKLREEGKLEGIASTREAMAGMSGSASAGAPNTEGSGEELSPEQIKWMEKLNVKDKEGAKKLYYSDETKRVPPAEQKAE